MSEPALEARSLTRFYGKTRGVENLSFVVNEGEIFGYLGPNGAGKTTTIRLFLNLIFPTSGSAAILGHDIVRDTLEIRRLVGYVPGDVSLYGSMKVGEYLDFISALRGQPAIRRDELLARFPVDPARRIRELSMGNRRKVSIIAAFQHDPRVYFLDEPTLGLDPLMQRTFYELLSEERKRGKTIFLSSHNLPEVERVCDRAAIIRAGQLVAIEDVRSLSARKVKEVDVWFAEPVDPGGLVSETVHLIEHDGTSARYRVLGDIDGFIKSLSRYTIRDVTISHASLEDVFFEFYETREGVS
jgi:ABC-2 type transport system ATP-binding protein